MTGFTLPWTQDLALLVHDLDDHHRALLEKLNALLVAISTRDPTRMLMAFSVLTAAAEAHFVIEEAQMRDIGYPDFDRHYAQHRDLLKGLAELRSTIGAVETFRGSMGPFVFLERWFVPHLTHDDRKWADYLASRASATGAEMV